MHYNNNYRNNQRDFRSTEDDFLWQRPEETIQEQINMAWQYQEETEQEEFQFLQSLQYQGTECLPNQSFFGNFRRGRSGGNNQLAISMSSRELEEIKCDPSIIRDCLLELQGLSNWQLKQQILKLQLELDRRKIETQMLSIMGPGNFVDDDVQEVKFIPAPESSATVSQGTRFSGFGMPFVFTRSENGMSRPNFRRGRRYLDYPRINRPPPLPKTYAPRARKQKRKKSRSSASTAVVTATPTATATATPTPTPTQPYAITSNTKGVKKEEEMKNTLTQQQQQQQQQQRQQQLQQSLAKLPEGRPAEERIFGTEVATLFDLKNPVKLIREMIPDCDVEVQAIEGSVPLTFKARVVHLNEVMGEGVDVLKESAAEKAAEDAMKTIFRWFFSKNGKQDEFHFTKNVFDMGNSANVFPWHEFASVALYKLFTEWQKEGANLRIGASKPTIRVRDFKIKKPPELPANAENMNPVVLLQNMRPGIESFDIERPSVSNMYLTKVGYNIDGRVFIGIGQSKKSARKDAAMMALITLYGVKY